MCDLKLRTTSYSYSVINQKEKNFSVAYFTARHPRNIKEKNHGTNGWLQTFKQQTFSKQICKRKQAYFNLSLQHKSLFLRGEPARLAGQLLITGPVWLMPCFLIKFFLCCLYEEED